MVRSRGGGTMVKTGVKRTRTQTQTRRDLQLHGETKKDESSDEFPDWAGLPEGPLHLILQRLNLHDCACFTKVCKSWRTFYKNGLLLPNRQQQAEGRIIPWLMMMGHYKNSTTRWGYSIMEDVSYRIELPKDLHERFIWGSYQDWLILLRKHYLGSEICLFNPFSRARIDLPKFSGYYKRMVLSSSPCDENCVFMLFESTRVAVWISGVRTWHRFVLHRLLYYEDAVFCQGQFYFVSENCDIAAIDVQSVVSAMKNRKDAAITEIRIRYLPIKMLDSPKRSTTRLLFSKTFGSIL